MSAIRRVIELEDAIRTALALIDKWLNITYGFDQQGYINDARESLSNVLPEED